MITQNVSSVMEVTGAPSVELGALTLGDRLDAPLLVYDREQRTTADQPFVILTLGNATGRMETAPFWSEDLPRISGIVKGQAVHVRGEIALYRDRRQLRVTSITGLPPSRVNWKTLLPSAGETSGYWNAIDGWRKTIRGVRLRDTLALFYDDPEFRRRYDLCPASVRGHHAMLGGLVRHTWEVATIAESIGLACGANVNLIIAGVLLHDIGKLETYSWDGAFEYTIRGQLLGHVVLGALMLDRKARAMKPMSCTEHELELLQHLILSHHGRMEFGAPVSPMTVEAEVLHYADNASAKTASMREAVGSPDNFIGDELVSARALWQLDRRRVYRGNSDWGE